MSNDEKILALLEQMQGDIAGIKEQQAAQTGSISAILEQQAAQTGSISVIGEQQEVHTGNIAAILEQQEAHTGSIAAVLAQQEAHTGSIAAILEQQEVHTKAIMSLENKVMHELQMLNELLPDALAKREAFEEVEAKVDDHDSRIYALEQAAANQ